LIVACFSQKLDSFSEIELEDWIGALEFLKRILFVDYSKFTCVSGLHVFEHEHHQFANEVQNFEVMILELHLQIEACELTEMTIGV
jgi:hypothetical protein